MNTCESYVFYMTALGVVNNANSIVVCVKSHTQTNTHLSQMVQLCEPESEQHVSYSIEIYANWHPTPEQKQSGGSGLKAQAAWIQSNTSGVNQCTSVATVKESDVMGWDTMETHRKLMKIDFSQISAILGRLG